MSTATPSRRIGCGAEPCWRAHAEAARSAPNDGVMTRKVVMIGTSSTTQGGVGAVISVYVTAGLFDSGDPLYLATHRDGSFVQKLGIAAAAWTRYLGMLLGGQVRLLHVHSASGPSFWRKFFFMLPTFMARCPVVLHWHGGGLVEFYARSPRWQQQMIAWAFVRCRRVVALSEQWQLTLLAMFPRARVVMIGNPVMLPALRQRSADAQPCLLFLGRVIADKGIEDLLQALPAVLARVPACRLVVAGAGELGRYHALAEQLGVGPAVHFPGWVEGAAKTALFADATVFVLPSHVEAMPMAVLEAMAHALPVVATRVGGVPQAVRAGIDGLLIEVGRREELATALIRLLCDAQLRNAMGSSGRTRIFEEFSADRVLPRVRSLWCM
jgi:glycosyltransferase involved in cell wall biosynthesis